MTIKLTVRNFYPNKNRKFNYFPIIHFSFEKYSCCTQMPQIEVCIIGFCFAFSFSRRVL